VVRVCMRMCTCVMCTCKYECIVYTLYRHRYCASVILHFVATFGPLLLNKMNELILNMSVKLLDDAVPSYVAKN